MATQRKLVLLLVFFFDLFCYLVRFVARGSGGAYSTYTAALSSLGPQLLNMLALHSLLAYVNRRSSRLGSSAARQVPS